MKESSSVTDETCPLIALQRELAAYRECVRRDSHGKALFTAMFDAYRSNLVAPDSLLTCIAKNLLTFLIELTPPNMRSQVDVRICDELRRNGLITKRSVLKSDRRRLCSMRLSTVFCTLLVAGPVFESAEVPMQEEGSCSRSALLLLKKFTTLVARTYWTPRVKLDGPQAVSRREAGEGRIYLMDLQSRAVHYKQSVNELCTKSTIVAKHLDKPNWHRLLELYMHTFLAFGHVNHFMELVFESAHKPLKRCITRGNHRNEHLSAMDHCLGNDWQARLILLRRETESADQHRKERAVLGLKRLLLGVNRKEISEADPQLDQDVREVFTGPVEYILKLQCAPMALRSDETTKWLGRGKSFKCDENLYGTGPEGQRESEVLHRIWELYMFINPTGPDRANEIRMYREMTRRLEGISGALRSTGTGVDRIEARDVVQVFVIEEAGNSSMITTSLELDAIAAIYCVICIIDDGEHGVVMGVLRCDTEGGLLRTRNKLESSFVQLLPVNGHVRRVGIAHACFIDGENSGNSCTIRDRERKFIHTKTVVQGGVYYYFTREMGYPPRMA